MAKDIIVAMSAVFILWVAAIFVASSRLVTRNWRMFRTWRRQPRQARANMALWLGVPILMAGLAWMRGIAMWHYASVYGIPTLSLVQMFVYLPAILFSLALILWWVCSLAYGGNGELKDADLKVSQAWRRLMYAGIGLAGATLAAIWLL